MLFELEFERPKDKECPAVYAHIQTEFWTRHPALIFDLNIGSYFSLYCFYLSQNIKKKSKSMQW